MPTPGRPSSHGATQAEKAEEAKPGSGQLALFALDKVCCRCGERKALADFHRSARRKDGRQGWCRACSTAYRAARQLDLRAYDAQRRVAVCCRVCGHTDTKHLNGLRTWDGMCHQCANRTLARHPDVLAKRRVLGKIQYERQGGIPNSPTFTSAQMAGAAHWNWQGGKTKRGQAVRASGAYARWRRAVLRRDAYTCQQCGLCGGRGRGAVCTHHIVPLSERVDLALDIDNGLTLCRPCHKQTASYLSKQSRAMAARRRGTGGA